MMRIATTCSRWRTLTWQSSSNEMHGRHVFQGDVYGEQLL